MLDLPREEGVDTSPSLVEKHEEEPSLPTSHRTSTTEQPTQTQQETILPSTKPSTRGTIAGGIYLSEARHSENIDSYQSGPLAEVDFDLPLTHTVLIQDDGAEYILLKFAPGDKQNPFNWSMARKSFITALLCLMTLFIGLATTAYSSGIGSMTKDLGVSTEMGELGLFCFNMACAIAPLFLAPFCELVGRRVVYVGAYACFVIIFIGLALGRNIATILVMRTLSGLFGCVGTILVGGTFSDIFEPDQRAVPMACFTFVAIFGTVAAPIYAGFIDETIGWRWIEGVQGLANLPLLAIIAIGLKETRGGVTLKKRAKMLNKVTGDGRYRSPMDMEARSLKDMLHNSSVKAIHMLVTEPVVFAFGLWIAFAWFVTFLFLSLIPLTFTTGHGWSEGISGLPYISLCIGVTIAFILNFLQIRKYNSLVAAAAASQTEIQDQILNKGNGKRGGEENVEMFEEKKETKVKRREVLTPESRLYGAMYGAVFLPIGLLIYSFTQYSFVPWIAPTIALAPISMGIFFIFESTYSYTADCYGENSSSAIAGQGLMRNALGAVAPLFATQFFEGVGGEQYAGLILTVAAGFLTLIPFVMFKWGSVLRARSRLANELVENSDGGD